MDSVKVKIEESEKQPSADVLQNRYFFKISKNSQENTCAGGTF